MRDSLNIVIIVFIGCALILTACYGIFAQAERAYESPRAMFYRLQKEIEDMQAIIAENPSSPEAEMLKRRIQWNSRKIKEILPGANWQAEVKIGKTKAGAMGLEYYMVIAQKNLFTPLGSGEVVKTKQFFVTGILGSGTRRIALINVAGESGSYYVTEGDEFGNGARIDRIMTNSVTISYEGNRMELRLGEGEPADQPQYSSDAKPEQRGRALSKDEQAGVTRREETRMKELEEEGRQKQAEREYIENTKRKVDNLRRERDEVKRRIREMEASGQVDEGAYRKIEEIDRNIQELESSLR